MQLLIEIDDSKVEEALIQFHRKIKEVRGLAKQLNTMPGVKVTLASEKADAEAPALDVKD